MSEKDKYNFDKNNRKVILDTETTGKSDDGTPGDHRIVEIGCVEMIGRNVTGRNLQIYLNPDRPVDPEAFAVHGISDEFLANQPHFHEKFEEFYDFIKDSELVIHNAKFDIGFINKEFELDKRNIRIAIKEKDHDNNEKIINLSVEEIANNEIANIEVTDSIKVAREKYPTGMVSLDALCSKLGIDNSARTSHGALLDSEILAEVFLALTGGQEEFNFGGGFTSGIEGIEYIDRKNVLGEDYTFPIIEPSAIETIEHIKYILELTKKDVPCAYGDKYYIPDEKAYNKKGGILKPAIMANLRVYFCTEELYCKFLDEYEEYVLDELDLGAVK